MSAEAIIDRLVEMGILVESEGEKNLQMAGPFRKSFYDKKPAKVANDMDIPPWLDELFEDDPALLSLYQTINEYFPGSEFPLRVQVLALLDHFRRDSPPSEGAPDMFLPVHMDQVELLLRSTDKAILYIWREDCEPCVLVRDDLDSSADLINPEIGLFAAYGPDDPRYLRKRFDVTGGPAVLFARKSRVDKRLIGARHKEELVNEIKTFNQVE